MGDGEFVNVVRSKKRPFTKTPKGIGAVLPCIFVCCKTGCAEWLGCGVVCEGAVGLFFAFRRVGGVNLILHICARKGKAVGFK
jgi:hypothetical protein